MDFTKLNNEFANMQRIISKYNSLQNEIKNRIKINLRDINKYETKVKNSKNAMEKECYKIMIISLKQETIFLENIIKESADNDNEKEKAT